MDHRWLKLVIGVGSGLVLFSRSHFSGIPLQANSVITHLDKADSIEIDGRVPTPQVSSPAPNSISPI